MLMPRLGALLQREAPGLRAQLVNLVPQDYVASLDRRNADLAMIPDTTLPEWVAREPLFRSPFHVIARRVNLGLDGLVPGKVTPYAVFCALNHVLFSPEGNVAAMGDAALAQVRRARRVAMTVPVFSGVCRAVSQSDLIALVPAQLVAAVAKTFYLQVFEPPIPMEPLVIVGIWHRRSDAAPMPAWVRARVFNLMRRLERYGGRSGCPSRTAVPSQPIAAAFTSSSI